VLSPCLFAY